MTLTTLCGDTGTYKTPNNCTNIFQGMGTWLFLTPGFNDGWKNPRNRKRSEIARLPTLLLTFPPGLTKFHKLSTGWGQIPSYAYVS